MRDVRTGWPAQQFAAPLPGITPHTVVGSDINLAVNSLNYCTISGLTAARSALLPTTAQTGDWVDVKLATDAPSTHAYVLQIKSGASGDLIDGTDHSSTIWSALFIKGEFVRFRCVDGSTCDWIVEVDRRIPSFGHVYHGGYSVSNVTITHVPSSGITTNHNVGGVVNTGSTYIELVTRRAGTYELVGIGTSHVTTAGPIFYTRTESDPNGTPVTLTDIRETGDGDRKVCQPYYKRTVAAGVRFGAHTYHNQGSTQTHFFTLILKEELP